MPDDKHLGVTLKCQAVAQVLSRGCETRKPRVRVPACLSQGVNDVVVFDLYTLLVPQHRDTVPREMAFAVENDVVRGGTCAVSGPLEMTCAQLVEACRVQALGHIARVEAAARGRSTAELNASPGPGVWSPLQVVEHLVLANGPYLAAMESAIAAAPRGGGDFPARHTMAGRLILASAGPEGRAPAPRALHPRTVGIGLDVVGVWRKQQAAIVRLAEEAAGVDLCRVRIRNPFFRVVRMNLADCFAILAAHTERHVRQIEERVATGAGSARAPSGPG